MKMRWKYLAALILLSLVLTGSFWDALAGSSERSETLAESNGELKSESNGGLSGQELWSDNCQRCHNLRSPDMQTPVQWQIIVHHMRVRANITGADARAITDFLKSASK
jgi:nitrate/TMAO reductase-like tetraheme cytochrome c subunit